jgi:hypothetical protein
MTSTSATPMAARMPQAVCGDDPLEALFAGVELVLDVRECHVHDRGVPEFFCDGGNNEDTPPVATRKAVERRPCSSPCQGLAATAVTVGLPLRRWRRSRSFLRRSRAPGAFSGPA